MLNAAPIAQPDQYLIERSPLEVDLPSDVRAIDESFQIPNLTPNFRLVVDDGSHLQHPGFITIGGQENTYGEIVVTNPGSAITFNQFLELAYKGYARMTISNGGRVHTTNWTELAESTGSAEAIVTGTGSSWQNDNFFVVGDNGGRGRLVVADGATFHSANHMTVGDDDGTGFVYVTGGATVTLGNWMEVGGHSPKGYGKIVVSGQGSSFTGSGGMGWVDIGDGGYGELQVSDGGLFTSGGSTHLSTSPGSHGIVNVGPGGRWEATSVYAGQGGDSIITVLDSGIVHASFIENYPTGRIRGNGLIDASWINNQGRIEPGAGIGTLTLRTRLTASSGGVLQFDVAGTQQGTSYDHLRVDGQMTAGGQVHVQFQDGFAPHAGDTFNLIQANSVSGVFSRVVVEGLEPGFQYETRWEGNVFKLIALNDGVALPETETPIAKGVLKNDSDADGDALRVILVDRPDKGALQLYANGAFRYEAGGAFNGSDTFQYKVTDGFHESAPVTVTIENPPPVAVPDAYNVDEDQTLFVDRANGVLSNDTDEPGAPLTAQLAHGPSHGELDFFPDGSFAYRPALNFAGTDTFTYTAYDGLTRSERGTVTITVNPVNDPPVARLDRVTTVHGTILEIPTWFVLQNDSDPEGTQLTVTEVRSSNNTNGTVSLGDGTIAYTSNPDFVGLASFVYVIQDADGATAEGTVNIEVRGPAPTAVDDEYHLEEDDTLIVDDSDGVLANDSPAGTLQARLVTSTRHGRLSLASDGTFSYEPDRNFFGTDTFIYRAVAGEVPSEPAIVTLHVSGSLDPPVARPDTKTTQRDRQLAFAATDLLINDFDPDGDDISIVTVEAIDSTAGTVSYSDGQVVYTPAPGFTGTDRFRYAITDGNEEASAIVEVRVANPVTRQLGRVQGAAWLDDFQRTLSVNVSSTATGVTGSLRFADFENEVLFVAKTFDGLEISRNGRVAVISGVGRMNGAAGFSYTATIEDRDNLGRQDRVRVQITGPDGFRYDSLDYSNSFGRLSQGDMRVMPVGPVLTPVRTTVVVPAANDIVLAASYLQEETNPLKKKVRL